MSLNCMLRWTRWRSLLAAQPSTASQWDDAVAGSARSRAEHCWTSPRLSPTSGPRRRTAKSWLGPVQLHADVMSQRKEVRTVAAVAGNQDSSGRQREAGARMNLPARNPVLTQSCVERHSSRMRATQSRRSMRRLAPAKAQDRLPLKRVADQIADLERCARDSSAADRAVDWDRGAGEAAVRRDGLHVSLRSAPQAVLDRVSRGRGRVWTKATTICSPPRRG